MEKSAREETQVYLHPFQCQTTAATTVRELVWTRSSFLTPTNITILELRRQSRSKVLALLSPVTLSCSRHLRAARVSWFLRSEDPHFNCSLPLSTHAVLGKKSQNTILLKSFFSDQGDSCPDNSAIPDEPFIIRSTLAFISVAHEEQDAGFPCYRFYGKHADVIWNASIAKHFISGAPRSWKSNTAMESVLLDIYKN